MPELFLARPTRTSLPLPQSPALPAALTLGITIGGVATLLGLLTPLNPLPPPLLFLFWVGLLVAAESRPVRLPHGGSLTVALALDGAAIVLFGPVAAAWIDVVAGLATDGVVRRRRPRRVAFDLAGHVLATLAGGGVYLLLGGSIGALTVPAALPAFASLMIVHFVVRRGLASIAQGFLLRSAPWRSWLADCRGGAWHLLALVPLGAQAAIAHVLWGWWTVGLVLLPLIVVHRASRLHAARHAERDGFAVALIELLGEIDPYTKDHSLRVASYAEQLARALGRPEREVEQVRLSGLLHDVGKIGQARQALTKSTRLSDFERLCMQDHPGVGAGILERVPAFREVAAIIRHHHERLDGQGYPEGMGGEAIPLGSRVILVADAFDAMTSNRPYRSGMPVGRALAELERCQGWQVDPHVVATLRGLVERGELKVVAGRRCASLRHAG